MPTFLRRLTTLLPSLASLALLVALGVSIAWGYGRFSLPAPVPAAEMTQAPSQQFRPDHRPGARLLGVDVSDGGTPPVMQLQGVVASVRDTQGSAVISLDSKPPVAVFQGEEVASGWVLSEVKPDHVVISKGGMRHQVHLPVPEVSADGLISASPSGVSAQ